MINKKTAKVSGAGILAVVILLGIIFALPIMGTGPMGFTSTGDPNIGGEFGSKSGLGDYQEPE